jgi:hypothetical protein
VTLVVALCATFISLAELLNRLYLPTHLAAILAFLLAAESFCKHWISLRLALYSMSLILPFVVAGFAFGATVLVVFMQPAKLVDWLTGVARVANLAINNGNAHLLYSHFRGERE